mmetsp:Transcript_9573/g.14239  ORF Transcript_9573/g.14239 Transcript_9573/m.14239 type:complete len:93 (-) Transcript_9573:1206-1484(-)
MAAEELDRERVLPPDAELIVELERERERGRARLNILSSPPEYLRLLARILRSKFTQGEIDSPPPTVVANRDHDIFRAFNLAMESAQGSKLLL